MNTVQMHLQSQDVTTRTVESDDYQKVALERIVSMATTLGLYSYRDQFDRIFITDLLGSVTYEASPENSHRIDTIAINILVGSDPEIQKKINNIDPNVIERIHSTASEIAFYSYRLTPKDIFITDRPSSVTSCYVKHARKNSKMDIVLTKPKTLGKNSDIGTVKEIRREAKVIIGCEIACLIMSIIFAIITVIGLSFLLENLIHGKPCFSPYEIDKTMVTLLGVGGGGLLCTGIVASMLELKRRELEKTYRSELTLQLPKF